MSKFIGIIVGGLEIALGVIGLIGTLGLSAPLTMFLITSGVGMVMGGLGTLIAGAGRNSSSGIASAVRNAVAPWTVIYGRARVGGIIVYMNEWGDKNKYLDMIMVLASHTCKAVDALLFDGQRIQLNGDSSAGSTGTSFSPLEQLVMIAAVSRVKGVVTVELVADIPYLQDGDTLIIEGITGIPAAYSLNGKYVVDVIGRVAGRVSFTYICGGLDIAIGSGALGQVRTTWPDYRDRVYMEVLHGDHAATFSGMLYGTPTGDGMVVPNQNPWTDQHKLLGHCCVFVRLAYDENVFSSGIPQISFRVRGKADISDPRTSPPTIGYSENAALCIADYLHQPTWGFNAAYGTEIPTAPLIAAANVCDEAVPLLMGGTEPRYTCNGQFQVSVRRGEVLQNLLTCCAGRLAPFGGQFVIQPAAWVGRSIAYDQTVLGSMVGPFRWRPKVASRDLYNGVKGTYISPVNNWQASDMPPYAQDLIHGYTSDLNMAADGGARRWLDIQLPFTVSSATAQRIAKIELLRRRQQGTGTFALNLSAYRLTALDIISMSLDYFSWTDKLLEVLAFRFKLDRQSVDGVDVTLLGTEIDVQEADPGVYAWNTTEELTAQGYQQSAIPSISNPAPPTFVTLLSDSTTVAWDTNGLSHIQVKVSWIAPADGYVLNGGHIELQYQDSVDAPAWKSVPRILPNVTVFFIADVIGGQDYNVQVRSVNVASVPSAWISAGPVVAAGGIPAAPISFRAYQRIEGAGKRSGICSIAGLVMTRVSGSYFSPLLVGVSIWIGRYPYEVASWDGGDGMTLKTSPGSGSSAAWNDTGSYVIGDAAAGAQYAYYAFSGVEPADSFRGAAQVEHSVWDLNYLASIPTDGDGWYAPDGAGVTWGKITYGIVGAGMWTSRIRPQPLSTGVVAQAFRLVNLDLAGVRSTLSAMPSGTVPFSTTSFSFAIISISFPAGVPTLTSTSGAPFTAAMVGRSYLLNGIQVAVNGFSSASVVTIALDAVRNAGDIGGLTDTVPLQDFGLVTLLTRPQSVPTAGLTDEGYWLVPIVAGVATPDISQGINQEVALTANTLIAGPINVVGPITWSLILVQDATGGWVVSFDPAIYRGSSSLASMLSTLPNTYSSLDFIVRGDGLNSLSNIVSGVPVT